MTGAQPRERTPPAVALVLVAGVRGYADVISVESLTASIIRAAHRYRATIQGYVRVAGVEKLKPSYQFPLVTPITVTGVQLIPTYPFKPWGGMLKSPRIIVALGLVGSTTVSQH